MPLGDYLIGLLVLAGTWGCVLAASVLVVRRRLPQLAGAPKPLAVIALATAGVFSVELLPGLVGLLSRWTALGCAIGLLVLAAALPAALDARPEPAPEPVDASGRVSWGLAGLAAGGLGLWIVATAWASTRTPPAGVDTLTFHLPNIARWIQTGTFWRVDQFTPLLANGNYPQTGDVVILSVVLPWRSYAFARLVEPIFQVVTALAVYALARELRAPRATSVLAGTLVASIPVVVATVADGAQTDVILYALLAIALLFLLRFQRLGRRSELVLGGLALGLAFGTKWYGVSLALIVIGVWTIRGLGASHDRRRVLGQALGLGLLVLVTGGFWLLRNLVESGDPLYPVKVAAGGVTVFNAPHDFIRSCGGFTLAHYLGSPHAWRRFILPAWWLVLALAGPVLLVGWAAALGKALGSGRRRATGGGGAETERGAVLALVAVAALSVIAYAVTPYTAIGPRGFPAVNVNARYLVPSLLVAAPLGAWVAGRAGRWRVVFELVALVAVAHGIRRAYLPGGFPLGEVVAALAVLAAGGGLALLARRRGSSALVAAAALGVAAVVVGDFRQREFIRASVQSPEPTVAWIAAHAPAGHRIGLAGVWGPRDGISPVLGAFGPRLGDVVSYNGRLVEGQLREYERRGPWAAAIRRRRYDLLLVGGIADPGPGCVIPGQHTDDNAWARQEGFRVVARSASDRLTLYRITRPAQLGAAF